jgi:hypothetical protein
VHVQRGGGSAGARDFDDANPPPVWAPVSLTCAT